MVSLDSSSGTVDPSLQRRSVEGHGVTRVVRCSEQKERAIIAGKMAYPGDLLKSDFLPAAIRVLIFLTPAAWLLHLDLNWEYRGLSDVTGGLDQIVLGYDGKTTRNILPQFLERI